jgi:hypothetical protein
MKQLTVDHIVSIVLITTLQIQAKTTECLMSIVT